MIIFVVAGRLGKSLTVSKVVPFLATGKVRKIFVFRQEAGFPLPSTEYITLPQWLLKIRPSMLSRFFRLIWEPLQLIKYTRKYRPNLINGVFTLPKGLNSTLVGLITRTPSMVSVIGGIVEITTRSRFKSFMESLNLWMLKKCTIVTTKGSVVNDYIIGKGIDSSKIFILNGSIDTDQFYHDSSITKDIDILFAGAFRPLKGPDRVLRVVQKLKKELPDIKAVFLGNGKLFPVIKDMVMGSELEDNVILAGQVDRPESWFQRSKCILLPSRSEGLPTSMLEAMACGCVPVVSDVGNIREAAVHEVNALLVKDYMDVDAFAGYTEKLLKDDVLRSQMAQKGINTVHEKYTPDKQAQIVEDIFKKANLI